MLRNLLYSFFFHVLFIGFLILSTIEFDAYLIKSDVTPLTINFVNDNVLENIKEINTKNENSKLKNVSLDEKIDLYNRIKAQDELKKSQKTIYEKSNKQNVNNKNLENAENIFSYHFTPIYVAEDKFNTEQKRKLIENKIKKEELRRKIKERNIIPKPNLKELEKLRTIEEVVSISTKPLIVKNKKNEKSILDLSIKNNIEEIHQQDTFASTSLNDLIGEINMNNLIIDERYLGITENEIFNKNDVAKLEDINNNKEDIKYMLTLREKRNIRQQIKGCYKMAILRSKKDNKAVVGLTVQIAQDGIIKMNTIKVNKIIDNFDRKGFEIALENAKSALVFCSPLRGLPSAKYKAWREMTFVFDSNNLE